MKPFQYQIQRYLHDRVTGEFVNVGVVVFSKEDAFLKARVITRYKRISQFYGEFDGHFILKTLKNIQVQCDSLSGDADNFNGKTAIQQLTSQILPTDDSALYFTEPKTSIDINPETLLDELFNRLIDIYTKENADTLNADEKAWKGIYKQYFEKYKITHKLTEHSVKTSIDEIKFDKAWKNGVWHCYQTVSFDLKTADAIKDKVYKWVGKVNQIKTSKEGLNLYLLTSAPKEHTELNAFVDTILQFDANQNVKVTVIKENEADQFALEVKREMEESALH